MSNFSTSNKYDIATHDFFYSTANQFMVVDRDEQTLACFDLTEESLAIKIGTEGETIFLYVGTAEFAEPVFPVEIPLREGKKPFAINEVTLEGYGTDDLRDFSRIVHVYDLQTEPISLNAADGYLTIQCQGVDGGAIPSWYEKREYECVSG